MTTRKLLDGSTEFSNGGFNVTVKPDGTIKVKPGDSLSKYSKAIYNDFDRMEKKFGRMAGVSVKTFQELAANINLINAGETIYHVPTHKLSKGIQVGIDELPEGIVSPVIPSLPTPIPAPGQLGPLLTWLTATANPIPNLRFVSSAGGDIGITMFTGQYFYLGLQDKTTNSNPEWFHGVGLGVSVGLDTVLPFDGTISRESFPSAGTIFKFPTAGAVLSPIDVCGAFVLLDIGAAAFAGGVSATILIFGFQVPAEFILRYFSDIFSGNGAIPSQIPFLPMGFVAMCGINVGLNAGVAIRVGMMQQNPFR